METILRIQENLTKNVLQPFDINDMKKIFMIRRGAGDETEEYVRLKEQVKNTLEWHEWRVKTEPQLNKFGIKFAGKDDFMKNFFEWYTTVPEAKDSLCMGFVQALVARHKVQNASATKKVEHFFGCTRQKKREFTVSDFVSYVESLEIALKEMVDFNFRSGKGRSGYLCTINSFLSQITQELRANNANVSNQSDESGFGGVDVDYNRRGDIPYICSV